jgi:putative ABC transport system permease protein
MWNRKRGNAWITLELLPVFCLTWYITDYLFVLACNYSIPNHRHVENTLQVNLSEFEKDHPEYSAADDETEKLQADFSRILQTLRNYPGVEAIGISFDGSTPGGGSYYGRSFRNAQDTALSAGGQCITIDPEYDYFKVFGFSADNGKKKLSTGDFEWPPNGIILSRSVAKALFAGDGNILGREVATGSDSEYKNVVIGVVDDTKRFDYLRPQNYFYVSRRLGADNLKRAEISVRYNASLSGAKFTERFKTDMAHSLRIGNFYLLNIVPYDKIGRDTTKEFGIDNDIRLRVYLMLFLLLCIFLCMTGVFWYRISLCRNETGLRKALGATRRNIRASLIIEGLWLLLLVTLPAMLIEYQFVYAELIETVGRRGAPDPATYLPDRTHVRFMITNGITILFLGIVIASAIWIPAQKSARLSPAEALHYE